MKKETLKKILSIFLGFLIPLAGLVCLVSFYLDILVLLMNNGIVLKENWTHAGASLFLIFWFSWRPYKWAMYKLENCIERWFA